MKSQGTNQVYVTNWNWLGVIEILNMLAKLKLAYDTYELNSNLSISYKLATKMPNALLIPEVEGLANCWFCCCCNGDGANATFFGV